jgi:hypothetical protein
MRMPEGLKNAGCTFSRMIAIVLHPQMRRNIFELKSSEYEVES